MSSIPREAPFQALEKSLAYRFQNPRLLREALRHRSYVNENPQFAGRDNERLEFLGDAVLNLVVSHVLMQNCPDMTEGGLSRTRAHLVNETHLAQVARRLQLGDFVQLGRGESQTGGNNKPSILSDTLEAVLAAIYLDGGFQAVYDVIKRRLDFPFDAQGATFETTDFKSRLQEVAQNRDKTVPEYHVVEESGPDHDKTFVVELTLRQLQTIGTGRNKKAAEQQAARKALKKLTGHAK
ncbi:MAG: ribonuclease III [Desulfobacterales bacterium]